MKEIKRKPRVALSSVVVVAALLSGCATFGAAAPEQSVQERSAARWKALIAGDLRAAYGYMLPSYRAVRSYEHYTGSIGGAAQWLGAEVVRVQCESGEKCTARVKIDAKPIAPTPYRGTISTGVDETWLLEDGQWWLYQKL